jgi:preprotein translocase subunit YajC
LLMFVVFYFLLIRPQQKRAKEHASMLGAIKKGDKVVTRGGIIGKVTGVQDNKLIVELQEKVRVEVLKSYIDGKVDDSAAKASADKADKKSEPATESKN